MGGGGANGVSRIPSGPPLHPSLPPPHPPWKHHVCSYVRLTSADRPRLITAHRHYYRAPSHFSDPEIPGSVGDAVADFDVWGIRRGLLAACSFVPRIRSPRNDADRSGGGGEQRCRGMDFIPRNVQLDIQLSSFHPPPSPAPRHPPVKRSVVSTATGD